MGLLDDWLVALDQKRKNVAGNVRELVADPGGLLGRMAIQTGEDITAQARGGLLGSAAMSSVMPQVRRSGMEQMLPSVVGMGPLQTVYHGSPHKFDKFDMSKIGTGEGAQAYGHGLYVADSPATASTYRNIGADETRNLERHVSTELAKDAPNLEWVEQARKRIADRKGAGIDKDVYGNLYKVDLPDEHIAKMLDWDAPLSKQSAATQSAVKKLWQEQRIYGDPSTLTGEGIHGSVVAHYIGAMPKGAAKDAATKDMRHYGIPGIKYLDGGSRAAGEGSRNYVVFDDKLLKILERQ